MIQLYSCLPFFRICFHLCSTSLWLQYCSTNVSSPSTPTVSHIKITQLRNSSEYPEQNTCSVLIYRKKNPTYGVFLLLLLRLRLWSSQDHRTTESQAHRITRTQNHKNTESQDKRTPSGGENPPEEGRVVCFVASSSHHWPSVKQPDRQTRGPADWSGAVWVAPTAAQ